VELFREAHGRLAALQARGRRLLDDGAWGRNGAESLARVDAPLRTKLAGLLQSRPLYFDDARTDDPFRDFRSLAEVEELALAVGLVERLGALLDGALGADLAALDAARTGHAESPARLSTLLLTAAGWHAVRGELRCAPLPADAAAAFVRMAQDGPDAARSMVEVFLAACASAFALGEEGWRAVGLFGRASADRLTEDVRGIDPRGALDLARLPCLVLAV
jgi:hypothetical protein